MINLKDDHKEVKRGDIFWHMFENTIMPVLVIQNDTGNKYSTNTIVLKMSSSKAVAGKSLRIPTIIEVTKDCIQFKNGNVKLDEVGFVLTSNIHTIPKTTLQHYIGRLDPACFKEINKGIVISLGL